MESHSPFQALPPRLHCETLPFPPPAAEAPSQEEQKPSDLVTRGPFPGAPVCPALHPTPRPRHTFPVPLPEPALPGVQRHCSNGTEAEPGAPDWSLKLSPVT